MTEEDILELVRSDPWMMQMLAVAREFDLPDWMIGAGFVRNKVWDHLHGIYSEVVPTADIDLIYFDPVNTDKERDERYSGDLKGKTGFVWEVVNQARTHEWKNRAPYKNSLEALSEWVETATSVAVRLHKDDTLALYAPHGIEDLVNLVVRPTPFFKSDVETFWKRINSKGWQCKWPKLTIVEE